VQKLWVLALLAPLGCRQIFGLEAPLRGDAGYDSVPTTDAGPCTSLTTSCGDPVTLRTCKTLGQLPEPTTCAWGCVDTSPAHCGTVVPTGGVIDDPDLAPRTDLAALTLTSGGVINTDTGAIGPNVRDPGNGLINGWYFEARTNGSVLRVKTFDVKTNMYIVGSRPLAIIADGDIHIEGLLAAQGLCAGNTPGPGGFAGGTGGNAADVVSGGGGGGDTTSGRGGGGGGHASTGGGGGVATGQSAVAGGSPFGDERITIMRGGGGGGGGGNNGGSGGGGGGALQLVSNGTIMIVAPGGINAGGCAGKVGDAGGGGGAGGTIVLEAPTVTVGGVLAVNGGGGAGASSGAQQGESGRSDRTRAIGGTSPEGTGGAGGVGGDPGGLPGASTGTKGSGGGGGIGRIRINSRLGTAATSAVQPGATMSPSFDDPLPATRGIATLR
jgi:hypothetical protein